MDDHGIFENPRLFLSSGDPVLREWFLINNGYHVLLLCTLYVIGVRWIGPFLMRNRKPFDLRLPMIIYNFLIVFSYVSLIAYGIHLASIKNALNKGTCLSFKFVPSEIVYKISVLLWTGYMIKFIEFMDTIFFVLRKKFHLISHLHVIHHTFVPLLAWLGLRTTINGFMMVIPVMNGLVHIVMYSYYGLAAIGPRVRKYLWWKRYLTIVQMSQFVVAFFLPFSVKLVGCEISKLFTAFHLFIAIVFFPLFYNYYRHTYNLNQTGNNIKKA